MPSPAREAFQGSRFPFPAPESRVVGVIACGALHGDRADGARIKNRQFLA